MEFTDVNQRESGGLDKAKLKETANRLREVRRRCRDDADAADYREASMGLIDAVLADLDASMESGAGSMAADDLDLGLATVEEMFRTGDAPGFVRVIASIRNSLSAPADEPSPVEELPPPRRFEPSPNDAVRRRRPKPKPAMARAKPAAATKKGRSGRLIFAIVVICAIGVYALVYLQDRDSETQALEPVSPAVTYGMEDVTIPVFEIPTVVPSRRGFDDDFDYQEEAMARFTLEIRMAESALDDGDINTSVRHFATAAAIDRHHHRVIRMGKALISAFLQGADLAYDAGNPELAGKRVKSARDLARGLRLDESPIDNTAKKLAVMTRFEDIELRDVDGLVRAVGHPVRLTLKSKDVVFGHLKGIENEFLLVDVYSGIKGGEAEFSTKILSSTIRGIRVYDATQPSEIVTGD